MPFAPPDPPDAPLRAALAEAAAPRDADGAFPAEAMRLLAEAGLTVPEALVPDPARGGMAAVLRRLRAVGRADAGLGRLLEGHADALGLILRLAPRGMRERALQAAREGALYGVWGADPPQDRLRVEREGEALRLSGAKIFCSGVDGLRGALVLAAEGEARALLFAPVDRRLRIDRDWWRPIGMRATGSHLVRFDAMRLPAEARLCDAEDYLAEPWFSGGAMRFAAVQAGMARGLAEVAIDHLRRLGRTEAPHQAGRLGALAAALGGADGVLEAAAASWDAGTAPGAPAPARARAAAHGHLARVAAERAGMETIRLVQEAVGCAGLMAPHPLERRLRDAMVYLRQPNPDGAREAAGRALAEGLLA